MKLNYYLAAFVFFCSSNLAVAEELDHYRVELILFSQHPVQGDDETWPAVAHRPAMARGQPLQLESALKPLSKDTAQMGAILYTLKQSSLYQPLLHAVWEQPGWPEDAAQPVRIEIPFDAQLPVTLFSGDTATFAGSATNRLEGTITIHRARYLHADFDLVYRQYINTAGPQSVSQLVEIPLQQKRRMRSKERHYIDHPRLGALIEITPVTTEQAPVEATPETN